MLRLASGEASSVVCKLVSLAGEVGALTGLDAVATSLRSSLICLIVECVC